MFKPEIILINYLASGGIKITKRSDVSSNFIICLIILIGLVNIYINDLLDLTNSCSFAVIVSCKSFKELAKSLFSDINIYAPWPNYSTEIFSAFIYVIFSITASEV